MADDPARVDLNLLKGFVALVDEWSTRAIARRLCLIRLWEDFGARFSVAAATRGSRPHTR